MPPINSAQKRSIRNSVSFLFNSVRLHIAKWISVSKGVHLQHTVIVITTFNTNATLKFVLCTQQANCMLKIRELAERSVIALVMDGLHGYISFNSQWYMHTSFHTIFKDWFIVSWVFDSCVYLAYINYNLEFPTFHIVLVMLISPWGN